MPLNTIYVPQAGFAITNRRDVSLITSGMTECIGIAFIDKAMPHKRLVAHMDGLTLEITDKINSAKPNIELMIHEFKKMTRNDRFDVYFLGGHKDRENYKNLMSVLKDHNITPVAMSSFEFCDQYNKEHPYARPANPTNVEITLECKPTAKPEFINFPKQYGKSSELLAGKNTPKDETLRYVTWTDEVDEESRDLSEKRVISGFIIKKPAKPNQTNRQIYSLLSKNSLFKTEIEKKQAYNSISLSRKKFTTIYQDQIASLKFMKK